MQLEGHTTATLLRSEAFLKEGVLVSEAFSKKWVLLSEALSSKKGLLCGVPSMNCRSVGVMTGSGRRDASRASVINLHTHYFSTQTQIY